MVRLYHCLAISDPQMVTIPAVALYLRNDDDRAGFTGLHNPIDQTYTVLVDGPQSVHDACYADRVTNPGRICYLSSLHDSVAHLRGFWGERFDSIDPTFRQVIQNRLLAEGLDPSRYAHGSVRKWVRELVYHSFEKQQAHQGRDSRYAPTRFQWLGEQF